LQGLIASFIRLKTRLFMESFADLSIKTCLFEAESAAIHHIRTVVFYEEQGIDPALDWDGLDQKSIHLVAKVRGKSVGVARLREMAGSSGLKLERLAVLKAHRQQGIGAEIVCTAIAYSLSQGYTALALHAQMPTVKFYEQLGFVALGEPFEEAGITHLRMEQHLTSIEQG
jgi:predicted GNAT family N-acyltransferase